MKKTHFTFRINPQTLAALQARANAQKRSTSSLLNQILVEAAANDLTPADGLEVLLPSLHAGVNQGISKAIDGLNSRLKHLLKRTLVSALANRLMIFQLLAAEFGPENAQKIYDQSTAEAEKRLEPTLQKLFPKSEAA